MRAVSHPSRFLPTLLPLAIAMGAFLGCSGCQSPAPPPAPITPPRELPTGSPAPTQEPFALGSEVWAAAGFPGVEGQRVGLLTNPAGQNSRGVSTIDLLRRAPSVNLVALFGPEHGIYGNERASQPIDDQIDARTGLPVFSLYGRYRKPTPAMLAQIDVLVIDLQDVGVRSYTFISAMRLAMEACFEHRVRVIVLDRPNPLGGLKVDGPPLDREWMSYVGAFPVPYVHGLTIGELARWAASVPGILQVSEEVRRRGQLTVIPMQGWRRSMLWSDTGLTWVPTSPNIPDLAAVAGYAMTGLGAQLGGFRHGVGGNFPFRILTFRDQPLERVQEVLLRHPIPGIQLVPTAFTNSQGHRAMGLYVQITDWQAWRPTEISFHMMRAACILNGPNPFRNVSANDRDLFNKHVGSTAWWEALTRDGAAVDVEGFVSSWSASARAFQQEMRAFWLYPP